MGMIKKLKKAVKKGILRILHIEKIDEESYAKYIENLSPNTCKARVDMRVQPLGANMRT